MMAVAGGWLGWSEDQFWSASPAYFYAALDGWVEQRGGGRADPRDEDEIRDAKAQYAPKLAKTSADLARMRELQRSRAG